MYFLTCFHAKIFFWRISYKCSDEYNSKVKITNKKKRLYYYVIMLYLSYHPKYIRISPLKNVSSALNWPFISEGLGDVQDQRGTYMFTDNRIIPRPTRANVFVLLDGPGLVVTSLLQGIDQHHSLPSGVLGIFVAKQRGL